MIFVVVPTLAVTDKSSYVNQDQQTSTHASLRLGQPLKVFYLHYLSHSPVLQKTDKAFRLRVVDKEGTVALARLEPAHVEPVVSNAVRNHCQPPASFRLPSPLACKQASTP